MTLPSDPCTILSNAAVAASVGVGNLPYSSTQSGPLPGPGIAQGKPDLTGGQETICLRGSAPFDSHGNPTTHGPGFVGAGIGIAHYTVDADLSVVQRHAGVEDLTAQFGVRAYWDPTAHAVSVLLTPRTAIIAVVVLGSDASLNRTAAIALAKAALACAAHSPSCPG